MSYIFSQSELTTIGALFDQRRYADAYDKVAEFGKLSFGISDWSDLDPSNWLSRLGDIDVLTWFRGAADVNRGTGAFSNFIRSYTSYQHLVRYGSELSTQQLDDVSDQIAESVLSDILRTGELPSIERIAEFDASPVAAAFFQGDPAAWSGNLLFVALGYRLAFEENILTDDDAYNALAMYKSITGSDLLPSMAELLDAMETALNSLIPFRLGSLFDALADNTAHVVEVYKAVGLDLLTLDHLILGLVGDDTGLAGTADDDLLHAGTGDDLVLGQDGDDLIDGGQGNDTLHGGDGDDTIFGGDGDDVAVFDGLRTDYRIEVDSGGEQTVTNLRTGEVDLLFSVEHLYFDSRTGDIQLDRQFVPGGGNVVPANDDLFSGPIGIGSVFENGLNFFGTTFNQLFVNNNGNVTFGQGLSTYTPGVIGGASGRAIIAPFWADVDTRGAGSLVRYGLDEVRGSFVATWDDVDFFDATSEEHQPKFNSFQLELVSQGLGDFEIIFRYGPLEWTTGDASEGQQGLGGSIARAGYSAGDGSNYFELPQSGTSGMLGLSTAPGTDGPGVWRFSVRNGVVEGIGTTGGDSLDGNDRGNFLDGAAGNDTINGGGGGDSIIGGDGNDDLAGDDGNDTIYGGDGDDVVLGGDGDDDLYGDDGNDTVLGGDGEDWLIAGHGGGDDHYSGGEGFDTVSYGSTTLGIVVDLREGTASGPEIGVDEIVGIEMVVGGSGDDRIQGDDDANDLLGGGGNDTIEGRGGDDYIDGGDGEADLAVFSGRAADYEIQHFWSDDVFIIRDLRDGAPDGVDAVTGATEYVQFSDGLRASADFLPGTLTAVGDRYATDEDGTLIIDAQVGVLANDDLGATLGSVTRLHGPFHGTLEFNEDGSFTYTPDPEFYGSDSFSYALTDGALTSAAVVDITVNPVNDAPIAVEDSGFTTAFNTALSLTPAEVLGNDGDVEGDSLSVTSVGNAVNGSVAIVAGLLVFTPTAGYSGPASFEYTVSDGNGGTDVGLVSLRVDTIPDGVYEGTPGNDVHVGTNEDDDIRGRGGNDRLYGAAGDDTMRGDAGNDTIVAGDGDDHIDGDTGDDRILGGKGGDGLVGNQGRDRISGEDGNDTIAGGDDDDVANGGAGDDRVHGQDGDDRLWGGAGDDSLYGGEGIDLIHGGDGDDYGSGGNGDDLLKGDAGEDRLSGGAGNDRLLGGADDDVLEGDSGVDTLLGGDGDDLLLGGADRDRLFGDAGDDALSGGDGNDALNGGQGDDALWGDTGNDNLFGGSGNDRLDGGLGSDFLSGGAGVDHFVFSFGADAAYDFTDGIDLIEIDSAVFGMNAGNVMSFVSQVGANTVIDDGAGNSLLLNGIAVAQISTADFIFT